MNNTAFTPSDGPTPCHNTSGPLHGLTFAVKDLIDVEGWRTGGGNPTWLSHAEPAVKSSPCVQMLLNSGAQFKGKTITDELAFSLEGANSHYGTPYNPCYPNCLPGGSSSGSASAVAQGLVDFALGTDTGGSVRIPAAWCGIFGLRPTHNAVSTEGVIPFAPSFDCIGWLAKRWDVLHKVSETLLPRSSPATPLTKYFIAEDVFAMAQPLVKEALLTALNRCQKYPSLNVFDGRQTQCVTSYSDLQGYEIWQNLGDAITQKNIQFGEAIAPRFAECAQISAARAESARAFRSDFFQTLSERLPEHGILVIPTSPCLPLAKDASPALVSDFYQTALCINAIAGHTGFPQLTVPIRLGSSSGTGNSEVLGLSFIAHRNRDLDLLQAVAALLRSGQLISH